MAQSTDTLPPPTEKARRRRRSSRTPVGRVVRRLSHIFRWQVVLLSLFVVGVVVVVGQSVLLTDAVLRVEDARDQLTRVLRTLTSKTGVELTLEDFERVRSTVVQARRSIGIAQQRITLLRPVANANPEWAALVASLDAADRLSLAGLDLLNGLQPTLFFLVSGEAQGTVVTQISSGERIVELLTRGRGQFNAAKTSIASAASLLDGIDLSGVSLSTLTLVEQMRAAQQQLAATTTLLLDAPTMLTTAFGLDQPVNYLVLAANSDELRPSGGYVSTYGWLTVRRGRITAFDYAPTRPDSPTPPPAALASQLDIPAWWLRFEQPIYAAWDGSWHADFGRTAAMAQWFYENGGNPPGELQGVIGIDLVGFEIILGALGSVEVTTPDGTPFIVTPQNFRQVVYDIRAFAPGPEPHKDFLADVYQAIFSRWQGFARGDQANSLLLGATLQAMREKHIMLFFDEPRLTDAIATLGWDGAQTAGDQHDYLMAVETNFGNKSNRSVIRQLTYDVEVMADDTLSSRVSISYDYPDLIARNDPAVNPQYHGPLNYFTLLQLITTGGSVPTTGGLEDEVRIIGVAQEGTHTVFASLFDVPYDDSRRVQFAYQTPPRITAYGPYKRYVLVVQKQPGTRGEALNVQVSLPPGSRVLRASPEPAAVFQLDQPVYEFRTTLNTDQTIEILYSPADAR